MVLRRAGYSEFHDRQANQVSYVRRLGTYYYPRFHLYVVDSGQDLQLNLHLDQKQPSYGVGHQHSGEYDGWQIEAEAERLKQFFQPLPDQKHPTTVPT
ncbi:MAG: hypothetical protein HYY50_01385 [Candidatus Kerfeldbacteria bacterium]|nr:hypothetical protein [Candidatus Kerfeldbacteria bacterium]